MQAHLGPTLNGSFGRIILNIILLLLLVLDIRSGNLLLSCSKHSLVQYTFKVSDFRSEYLAVINGKSSM
jgi:hypothetical protein